MTPETAASEASWSKLTKTFGPCRRCEKPGRPLFRYQLEPDHFDDDQPWTDEKLCMVNRDGWECRWCDGQEQPLVCPPCFGLAAAEERAELDASLIAEGLLDPRHARAA